MNIWIKKNKLYLLGALAGMVAGFLYWKFVGCLTGTCSITSNPWKSMAYFALLGALAFGLFKKNDKEKPKEI